MTALQLLSCKPGAFRRKETTGFFPQIIHSASSYFTSTKQPEPKYISALNLAKFLIERDTSWEATYP
ncbi:hypothetical protein CIPAW_09G098800 [Carya illinoinensis]|uniref:Uncharacterized protein n=1 Tax=Carya illinoinensis TaxID=32201 RepID=A0A8T1PIK2_CARIL|nr:hypothetical protein CIPAW_09G098800 [Carya illinoinensis]KAG6695431.1 hypothetical protein I3842_09G096600 [Carya illinoinensis]